MSLDMEYKSSIVTTGVVSMCVGHFQEFLVSNGWMLVLGLILVLVDLRFGLRAARYRKDVIKTSRALRRTIHKIIDYLCWITVAYAVGKTFSTVGIDLLPYVIMGVIYGIELESVAYNYFEAKGKKIDIKIWDWFKKKTDLEIIIKDSGEDKKDEKINN